MPGFVVVLRDTKPGVMDVPAIPEVKGLMEVVAQSMAATSRRQVVSPPKYLHGDGSVLGFTSDKTRAQVYSTADGAQAAINAIPRSVRPEGLSVEPVD